MSGLPEAWVSAAIGDLCELKNGRAFKPSDWSTTGIPIVRIQNLNNPAAPFNHYVGEIDERYHLRGGELLFAWSGTPGTSFGAHTWRGSEAVLNQHIFRVDFDTQLVNQRFFRYAINQKLDELIDVAHGGVGLRHVTKGTFERTQIAFPPAPEQHRIADKLDAALARVDAARARLQRVPALLKRFRQAVLEAATSGALTEEWRSKSAKTWVESKLFDVCDPQRVITYGVIKLGDHCPDGVPCLRTSNVRWLKIDLEGVKSIAAALSNEYSRTILRGGEVLVNVRGTLGGVAVARAEIAGWNVSREVAVVPVDSGVIASDFLAMYIASEGTQKWLTSVQRGVAYTGINIEDLRTLPIAIPPHDEQLEIVRRVEALFGLADRVEARHAQARARLNRLTPALLAKAFRGELVPQDPADEPAAALLARLRASRAVAPAKRRHHRASPRPRLR